MTHTKTVLLATTNEGKRREIQSFFDTRGVPIHTVIPHALQDVDETGSTFLANARLKAEAALDNPTPADYVMAEDSGFSVPALDGQYGHSPFPGVHSNRWMTPDIRSELLGLDSDEPVVQAHLSAGIYALIHRQGLQHPVSARYHCALVVLDKATGEGQFETEQTTDLTIVPEGTPAGPYGFGYDPVTCPIPEELVGIDPLPAHHSTSDFPTELKNRFSHRAKALMLWAQSL